MKRVFFLIAFLVALANVNCLSEIKNTEWNRITRFEKAVRKLYGQCCPEGSPEFKVFRIAVIGYLNMYGRLRNRDILAIVDYSRPSWERRFFVIDLRSRSMIFNTLAAHSEKSGKYYAKEFSNVPGSGKCSLGFYLTAETYIGRHGYSLRIDGMEPGINRNARSRAIVVHGAKYVSRSYMEKNSILGRSSGCPALPSEKARPIINFIKDGGCLYLYADDAGYFKKTDMVDPDRALDNLPVLEKITGV